MSVRSVAVAWAASLSVAFAWGSLPAQRPPAPDPGVDSLFARWAAPASPGCALGIVRDGRFVYRHGYGMANLDYGIPNSPDLVYYVGSDSKQFTAAVIGLLALDGTISLDDDIRKYFPEMRSYGAPVTVRHLVHHTSGIRDIYTLMSLAGLRLEDVFSDSAAIALIARQQELNFPPRRRLPVQQLRLFPARAAREARDRQIAARGGRRAHLPPAGDDAHAFPRRPRARDEGPRDELRARRERPEVLRFPDRHFSVLMTCNLGNIDPGALAFRIADHFLANELAPAAARATAEVQGQPRELATTSPTAEDLATLPGDYHSDELDVTYRVRVAEGRLVLDVPNAPRRPLVRLATGDFAAGGYRLRFERSASASPSSGFSVDAGRTRHLRFVRR